MENKIEYNAFKQIQKQYQKQETLSYVEQEEQERIRIDLKGMLKLENAILAQHGKRENTALDFILAQYPVC